MAIYKQHIVDVFVLSQLDFLAFACLRILACEIYQPPTIKINIMLACSLPFIRNAKTSINTAQTIEWINVIFFSVEIFITLPFN
jgi:hypothetical protein